MERDQHGTHGRWSFRRMTSERWRKVSKVEHRHSPWPIPLTRRRIGLKLLIQPLHQLRRKDNFRCSRILLQVLAPLRSGYRDDVVALRQEPGQGKLARGSSGLGSNLFPFIDKGQVVLEVLALESRVGPPKVTRLKVLRRLDGAGQNSAAQRAVSNKADTQPTA